MSTLNQTQTPHNTRDISLGFNFQRVRQLWTALTAPDKHIENTNDQRQARLLSALLVTFLVLLIIGLFFNAPVLPAIAMILPCYILSRTRYYIFAGILAMVALGFPSLARATIWTDAIGIGTLFQIYMWLLPPIILAKLVLPMRGMITVIALFMVGMFISFEMNPAQIESEFMTAMSVMFVMSIVLIVSALIQEQYLVKMQLEELREIQRRLARTNERLEAANQEVRDFAYIIAHDLRVPLVNMQGFMEEIHYIYDTMSPEIDKLVSQMPEGKQAEFTDMIHKQFPESLGYVDTAVERMNFLTGAILKLSRAGHRELDPQPMQTQKFVQNIVDTYHHSIEDQHINIEVDKLPDLYADPLILQQVFGNLLDNAIKYLDPSRDGHIRIYSEALEDRVVFHVEDNGIGIKQEQQSKVFQLFRRAIDQETTVQGDGLGLPYIRTLIQLHRGQIWFTSEFGQGSTFSFSIPTL